jgi:hypothetical protein
MREKILAQLVAICKDLTGVSEQTLGVFATQMALTVTEEGQIEAAIAAQKPILDSLQGNIYFNEKQAIEKFKLDNPIPKVKTPEELAVEKAEADKKAARIAAGGVDMEAIKTMMAEMLDPLKAELASSEKAKTLKGIKADAAKLIENEYGSLNENEQNRSDMAMRNVLLISKDPKDAETLLKDWKNEYNSISSSFGLSDLKPKEAQGGGEDNIPSGAQKFKEHQQNRGKLPKSKQ